MTRFERWAVLGTSALTAVTGFVYLWMKYWLTTDDPFAVVNHPWQPYVLKLHIVVAPLLTFAIGLIAVRHVWRHLKALGPRGRRTGLVTTAAVAPMIVTGYLIQSVTGAGILRVMALSHIGFGVVYALAILAHQVMLGRLRRS